VLEKSVEVGEVISSGVSNVGGGTTLAIVADPSRVFITADVDETDIGRVSEGLGVEVVPAVKNDEGLLKAGMNCTVDIIIAGRDDALVVPRKAVQAPVEAMAIAATMGMEMNPESKVRGGRYVFAGGAEGLELRPVEVGLQDWNQYEITGGLEEGEEAAVFIANRALQHSKEFIERIRGRSMPGFEKSSK